MNQADAFFLNKYVTDTLRTRHQIYIIQLSEKDYLIILQHIMFFQEDLFTNVAKVFKIIPEKETVTPVLSGKFITKLFQYGFGHEVFHITAVFRHFLNHG